MSDGWGDRIRLGTENVVSDGWNGTLMEAEI